MVGLLFSATPSAENVCTRYKTIAREFSALATNVSKNPSLLENEATLEKLQKLQERLNSVAIDAKYLDYEKVTEKQVNEIMEATRTIEQAQAKINSALRKYMN